MKNRRESNSPFSRIILGFKQNSFAYLRPLVENTLARLGIGLKVAQEGGWVFALRVFGTGLSFLSTVLLSRILGVNGYGVYAYALALVTLMALPAEAGLPNLIVRETARGMSENRPEAVLGAWRWSGQLVGIVTIALLLLVGIPLLFWRGGLKSQSGLTFAWALALVPLMALGNLRGAALRGLKKIAVGQLPEFIVRPGVLVLLLGAALFAGERLSPPSAMALYVLAAAISFLVGAWMLLKETPLRVREVKPFVESHGWLTSSILFALIAGFGVVNNQAGTVILGIFKSSSQVAIYRVAVQVSTLASLGLQTVNMMVAPRFADLYTQKKIPQLQRLVTISARIVLIFNLIFTGFFVLAGKLFFGLVFGLDFIASYLPLVILLGGQVLNSITGSVGYLLNMTGHERDTTWGFSVSAGVGVVLNFLLIPRYGTPGAAIASSFSMIVWNILLWRKAFQRLGINSLAFSLHGRGYLSE